MPRMEEIALSQRGNPLFSDYLSSFDRVRPFFEYDPGRTESFRDRLNRLEQGSYDRVRLAEGLRAYNRRIGNHSQAMENIDKLAEPNASVVIGGQQAGVALGPLYTVYKMITIIQVAQRESERLRRPVLPVFWIAGEDHDFDEVNHVYVENQRHEVEKIRLHTEPEGKRSVSHIPIPDADWQDFFDRFFSSQIETEFTAEWKEQLYRWAQASNTLVDAFARAAASLFGRYGLMLVDASLPFMRELGKETFRNVIIYNRDVRNRLFEQTERVRRMGYPVQTEPQENAAHFFLYADGERKAVEQRGDRFVTRDGSAAFGEAELLNLLEEDPERFSANVVTRPLVQENIFPTLAFVGGPGEIAYWAQYRSLFSLFDLQMPVIVPRRRFTLVEGTIEKFMRKFGLSVREVCDGFEEAKARWLEEQQELDIDELFAGVRSNVKSLYRPLIERITEIQPGLSDLGNKNLDKVLEQVNFLQKRTEQAFEQQHASSLRQLKRVKQAIAPGERPQERVYNIFRYLNKYGPDLLDDLLRYSAVNEDRHTVVYLSSQ